MKNRPAKIALRTCLIYAVIGSAWILFSGRILFTLVSDPSIRNQLEIYKGWGFVAITALALYFLLRNQLRRTAGEALERRQAEEGLLEKTALLEAQLNSSIDGILVVDNQGRKVIQNQRTIDLWKIPQEIVNSKDDEKQVQFVMNQTKYPEKFVEKVDYLYSHPNEIGRDEVELKDGTILDRYSSPVIGKDGKHYGRIWSFRDITEQKVSGEALHQSEAKFRSYVENAPLAVLVADQKRRVVDCNPAAADLLGYDVAALLSTSITDLHPEDDVEKVFQSLQTLATEGHAEGEFRFKRRDGTLIWVSLRAVLAGSGLSIAFCQDITERRVAAEAIANERQLLRTLIDLLPDTFYVKDLDCRFLIANKALAKHFGKEFPSEIVGRTDADFFLPECAAEYRAAELKVLGGEPLIDYEGDGIGPTGRRCTHLTTKVPFRDSQGRVQGLVGIGRDITERKLSEESHQRLATAVEQAAEAVVISDTDGKILYVNPAFETVTGYSKEEVIGRNPRILKSGKHDNLFYRRMWAVLSRGEVWSGRLINKKKDGTLFEEEANISPVRDSNGRITNYVAVKRDVTREVTLENQFRQSQKMEAFGQLAGGVAHDFNNLLTVIQGSASLLLNPQLNPEERTGCSRQIVQAAERAAGLTRQLLMFSRKHDLQAVTVNLNEVVGNMTKMLRRIVGEDIVLRAEYDPKIAAISADAGMMEQVLLNLAVNSRDAMPQGGQLLIATALEKLGANHPQLPLDMAPGAYVCLKVKDTGCGITPEVLPHIFEPFFTTKETGKGSGLGLATVYGIVQQHHGWVTATSEPGRGATFFVYLPAAVDTPAKPGTAPPPRLPHGTETILLAEDEPAVRGLVSNILSRCGYTILRQNPALRRWRFGGNTAMKSNCF